MLSVSHLDTSACQIVSHFFQALCLQYTNQGCQPWEIDFLTIYQKLPKFSLLNGIFSLLKHELVTDYFKQFPYFAENWPKSSLLRPKIPYRIRKFLTTWQPCTNPSPRMVGRTDECMKWQQYPSASMLAKGKSSGNICISNSMPFLPSDLIVSKCAKTWKCG